MEEKSYHVNYKKDDRSYWFNSNGPNGVILKVIIMQPMNKQNRFNLALADFINGGLDYNNISNNNDLEEVFFTIAEVVKHFTANFPDSEVFITGNTAVKTRLYRMKVSNNLELISKEFNIYGNLEDDEDFTVFRKGENYKGILVSRK